MEYYDVEILNPSDIEKRSFEIIEEHLKYLGVAVSDERKDILKRVIHTTADFEYIDNLKFSGNAVKKAVSALRSGAWIITDTQMAYSGINKNLLEKLGGKAVCYISSEDVAQEAKSRGITRAIVSMEKASKLNVPLIFAIGNAPTALIALNKLIEMGKVKPELVIGVPVGFVNVCESKELIMNSGIEYIVAKGHKGGSNVAAAICNALIYKLVERK